MTDQEAMMMLYGQGLYDGYTISCIRVPTTDEFFVHKPKEKNYKERGVAYVPFIRDGQPVHLKNGWR